MNLILESPVKLKIEGISKIQKDQLKAYLTYTDKSVVFEISRIKKNIRWFKSQEAFDEKIKSLKEESTKCLLFEDETGIWTYSGFLPYIEEKLKTKATYKFSYPETKLLPWYSDPGKKMYSYQEEALEKLLASRHAGVSIGTGLGKTFILANLIKRLGLKTVVMAPNTGIAEQIFLEFEKLFGEKYVGAYFDGKKSPKKLIVIANAQSLTRVKPDHEHWEVLNSTQVFIADESHQCPASTLASVCFGVLGNSPYRFFFSATQLRNDGSGILLDGITGPIVYEMSVREGVDKGFLARPQFHMKHLPPNGDFVPNDVNEATRHHLYYNPAVVREVGRLCNLAAARGLPVVVLIEEVEQFTKLLPYLKFQAGFAHGPLTENKNKVPKEYWESDPNKLVADFNELKYPILIGTSCISTGTDIRAVKFLIYWQGGKSEIQVKQAIGRGTRKISGKDKCFVTDFYIDPPQDTKSWPIGKHAQERKRIYEELYPPVFEE